MATATVGDLHRLGVRPACLEPIDGWERLVPLVARQMCLMPDTIRADHGFVADYGMG